MSMGFSMSLRMSPQLSMRQTMECKLTQEMRIEQKMVLEMRMYLEREDVCTKLYQKALARGDVQQYNGYGLTFEYARVKRHEVPKDILDSCGCGFAHCLFNVWEALLGGSKYAMARGSWLLFVVTDFFSPIEFPEEFVRYVAVHEHGEQVTLGEHHLATKLEFAVSKLERRLADYVVWIEHTFPGKFADVFSHQTRIVLPDSAEFQKVLEMASRQEYAARVRQMIEEFEWPAATLRRLNHFQVQGEKIQRLVLGQISRIQLFISDLSASTTLPAGRQALNRLMTEMLEIAKEHERYLCVANFQGSYREFRDQIMNGYQAFRNRRYDLLKIDSTMETLYLDEVAEAGEYLPTDGIYAASFRDAMKAV